MQMIRSRQINFSSRRKVVLCEVTNGKGLFVENVVGHLYGYGRCPNDVPSYFQHDVDISVCRLSL